MTPVLSPKLAEVTSQSLIEVKIFLLHNGKFSYRIIIPKWKSRTHSQTNNFCAISEWMRQPEECTLNSNIPNAQTFKVSRYFNGLWENRASLVAQLVKNPPAMQETWVWSLGWEDSRRRTWQPTPVFLPGESPWIEELGKPQSMGLQRVGHDWTTKHTGK